MRSLAYVNRQSFTTGSSGTKLFCVSGCAVRPGIYEAPFGITLRELITLAGEGSLTTFLRLSPDGNKLIALNLDSEYKLRLQIWRAPSWAEIESAEKNQKEQR